MRHALLAASLAARLAARLAASCCMRHARLAALLAALLAASIRLDHSHSRKDRMIRGHPAGVWGVGHSRRAQKLGRAQ